MSVLRWLRARALILTGFLLICWSFGWHIGPVVFCGSLLVFGVVMDVTLWVLLRRSRARLAQTKVERKRAKAGLILEEWRADAQADLDDARAKYKEALAKRDAARAKLYESLANKQPPGEA